MCGEKKKKKAFIIISDKLAPVAFGIRYLKLHVYASKTYLLIKLYFKVKKGIQISKMIKLKLAH